MKVVAPDRAVAPFALASCPLTCPEDSRRVHLSFMAERFLRLRLLYIVLGTLLVVGLLPLGLEGWMLSSRSAAELRSVEARYQAQLVQDKARQIELYGQRYRDVVTGLARAFELAGGVRTLHEEGAGERLLKTLKDDPNLI